MNFQFTNPLWLLLLPPAAAWMLWLGWKSDAQLGPWRRRLALLLRMAVTLCLCLAMAGLQWKKQLDGMNLFFLLDRSQSVPSAQQEEAKTWVNHMAKGKKQIDTAGVLVFGTDAAIESRPNAQIDLREIQAVVGPERTDVSSAIRLGTAAFPETGQKRLVLFSDGNENVGDALNALAGARTLGGVAGRGPARGGAGGTTWRSRN